MVEGDVMGKVEVILPKFGLTMKEATIGKWLKKEGDAVSEGETIAIVETGKATYEIKATATGKLAKILKKEGEVASIGEVIAIIETAEG